MGKTKKAGKWIRNVLLGKRSSKSNLSKREHILKSSEVDVSNSAVDSSQVSSTTGVTSIPRGDREVDCRLSSKDVNPVMGEEANLDDFTQLVSQEYNERIRHEEGVIKAQAVFRGYLARRAFRTLKGIVRLQAHIRGHLVRKQAVSTLYCLRGIVKFQALARGYKVRNSDMALAVVTMRKSAMRSNSTGFTYNLPVELSKSPFISRLLAASSKSIHVRLKYNSGDPNSAWQWLERWTNSPYLEFLLQPKKHHNSACHGENGICKTVEAPKRNLGKVSAIKVEHGLIGLIPDSEKSKQHRRKVQSHQLQSGQEYSRSEVSKVKHKSRGISSNSSLSDGSEVGNLKQKHISKKTPESTEPNIQEHSAGGSDEQSNNMAGAVSERFDVEKSQHLLHTDDQMSDLRKDHPDLQVSLTDGSRKGSRGIDIDSSGNRMAGEDEKPSQRRASLPAKFDYQDNGMRNSPRLPSYMAPTESVKARLRGQGSPKLSPEVADKIGASRRNSLSSSTIEKISSSSPRVERLLPMNGKGAIRADRSVSSFRDSGTKVIQPEWRR